MSYRGIKRHRAYSSITNILSISRLKLILCFTRKKILKSLHQAISLYLTFIGFFSNIML